MSENNIICCQCGAEIPASQTICTKCGCDAIKRFNVTVRKANGSYLVSALTVVTFVGENDSSRVAICDTIGQQIALRPGIYNVEIICGLLTLNTSINLTEDAIYDVGVKAGFFKNTLFMNKSF